MLLASGLALGRLAIGAGLMIAPELTLKTLGFEKPSASTLAVARLAGGRDLVLGAAETAARTHPVLDRRGARDRSRQVLDLAGE